MGGCTQMPDSHSSCTFAVGDDVAPSDQERDAQDAHPDGKCQTDWLAQDRHEEHHQRDAVAEVGQPPTESIAS